MKYQALKYHSLPLTVLDKASENRGVSALKNMLNLTVEWRRLKTNPIRATKKLKEPPGRLRFLTLEEIHKLLACCPPPPHHLRDIVMVALTTGMRRGEILTLRWDYVKLENRLMVLPETKNNTVRIVPINDTLYNALEAMPNRKGYVFGNGKPLTDVKRSFHTTCKKAGIENFRFHDLRHTYASHLAMRGVPGRVLQDLLGHKTAAMTARYTHLAPAALQSAQKLLDGMVG